MEDPLSVNTALSASPDLTPSAFDDDAFSLTASIKNAYSKDSYTVYLIQVSLVCRPQNRWEIEKRFKEFVLFDESLRKIGNWQSQIPKLPDKKWIGNKDREFISKRQIELEKYLTSLLSISQLNVCEQVRSFLYPDLAYVTECQEIQDTGKQQIALTLRSEPRFQFQRFLPQIGWRRRRTFALASGSSSSTDHFIVCWSEYCAKTACFEQEISAVLKWLQSLKQDGNAVLAPFTFASLTNRAVLTIQPLRSPALRDILRAIEHPLDEAFLKKYGPSKPTVFQNLQRGFSRESYYNMARSVCGTLIYFLAHFHSQGLFLFNIHAGNCAVDLKPSTLQLFRCLMVESHAALTGVLPPYYMRLMQMGATSIKTVFDVDMAAIGFMLEEIIESAPDIWQVPKDLVCLLEKLRPQSPQQSPATASNLVTWMRQEPAFWSLLEQKSSLSTNQFFDQPSPEVLRIYAKARASYERRLSLHHAVYYQFNAVRSVRRSLVAKADEHATTSSSAEPSVLFAN